MNSFVESGRVVYYYGDNVRVDRLACIGDPPEHRDHWREEGIPPVLCDGCDIGSWSHVDAGIYRATTIGARTKFLKHVRIGHDALIGDDCELAGAVGVGGRSIIGNRVKIGMGAQIRPRTTICDDVVIGMGTVVLKDIFEEGTYVGNPARRLR